MILLEKSLARLNELWSLTRYEGAELSEYAESLVFQETRKGIVILGLVSLLLLSTSALAYALLGFEALYVYSCVVLAVLSLHVAVSARVVQEINTLYLLGITLLVVNGVAFVLLAHHSGSLNSALFASVILLFLVMPLVPWGVREALLIVLLVYFLFTLSTISVDGRFEKETLWMLQFSMLGAGLTTLTVIGRNVMVRKIDFRTRFELEKAHDRMELLSLKDPLTGAWNRRFLDQKFMDIRTTYDLNKNTMHLALIDVDNFKTLNDSQGHDYGDLVLRRLVANFLALFSGNEHLIRMGGDEFLLILSQDDPENIIQQGATALRTDPQLFSGSADSQVNVSVGLVSIDVKSNLSLDLIYRQVDEELYQAKERKNRESKCSSQAPVLSGV
ncbi:MAG: GGDEF domain-containing protein [Candidatus Thiodiazotropha sp. (ex Troendleina suluensis)]|nr:GGDEF domain-containing protein [Candidatus Thiodiazotropha sp. (ex Troendleina suluensis)]